MTPENVAADPALQQALQLFTYLLLTMFSHAATLTE